jgi:signal transduction histidine kinase
MNPGTDYYKNVKEKKEKLSEEETGELNKILEHELKTSITNTQHLSNVISGINHEISPWLGSVYNIVGRLDYLLQKMESECPNKNTTCELRTFKGKCHEKFKEIIMACDQAVNILSMMSKNVKKVQTYAVDSYNVRETIDSWVKLILMDRVIKSAISENNIIVDSKSLDFVAKHSPMLLTQIILNLAKNSIEHNKNILDFLRIKISGHDNCLIYEDNGKGIPPDLIFKIFEPGITTKEDDKSQHGFGLSACMDYCIAMGALMWAESDGRSYTKFVINFDFDNHKSNIKKKYSTQEIVVYEEKRKRTSFFNKSEDRQYFPHDMETLD